MIFYFAVPTFVVVIALIWMAFVEPMGALAFIGKAVSGLLGFVFLLITLFGVFGVISNIIIGSDALVLTIGGTLIVVPFMLALVMRWVFRRLS